MFFLSQPQPKESSKLYRFSSDSSTQSVIVPPNSRSVSSVSNTTFILSSPFVTTPPKSPSPLSTSSSIVANSSPYLKDSRKTVCFRSDSPLNNSPQSHSQSEIISTPKLNKK